MSAYSKAIVPLVLLVIMGGGYYFHIIPANVWSEVISLALASLGTYQVTNTTK